MLEKNKKMLGKNKNINAEKTIHQATLSVI